MPKKASTKRSFPWHPKYLWALLGGLVLLGLGILLWQQFAGLTFNEQLIRKLPKDSVEAGVARLSAVRDAAATYGPAVNVYPSDIKAITATVGRAGVTSDDLRRAVDDQFAWAATSHGNIAVFTIASQPAFDSLSSRLKAQLEGAKDVEVDTLHGTSGRLRGSGAPVVIAVSGQEVYVASNAELIKSARNETDGFTSLPEFKGVSTSLPTATGGYIFFNTPLAKSNVSSTYSLVGMAWSPKKDGISIAVEAAPRLQVQSVPPNTSGTLLPPARSATASVGGTDAAQFLTLIEAQRQNSDLPKVLSLQNGIASLNRTLGVDLVHDYLGASTGQWTYGVYSSADGKRIDWMGALEFPSAQVATERTNGLIGLMKNRLTVPVRKEVVTILPDGSQSREVVSEGQSPVGFAPFTVSNAAGQSVGLPGIGTVYAAVKDRYLLLAGTSTGIERMASAVTGPTVELKPHGPIAIRVKVADAYKLLGDRDVLFDWITAAQPSSGRLWLDPQGVLSGSLGFTRSGR